MFFDPTTGGQTTFGGSDSTQLEAAKPLLMRFEKELSDTTTGGKCLTGFGESANGSVSSGGRRLTSRFDMNLRTATDRRLITLGSVNPEGEKLLKRVWDSFSKRFKPLLDKLKRKLRTFKSEFRILKKLIRILFVVPLCVYVYLFVIFVASVLGRPSTYVPSFQPCYAVLLVGDIFLIPAVQGLVQVIYMKENLELTNPFYGVELPGPLCLLTSTPLMFEFDTNYKIIVSIVYFIIFPGFLFFLCVLLWQCWSAFKDLYCKDGHGRVAYHPVLLEWTDLRCKHIKARVGLFPGNFLAKSFFYEAVGVSRVDRVLDDQDDQVFPMLFHNVSEPVAITFEEQGTFRRIASTRRWEPNGEAPACDEGLFNGSYHTRTKKFKPEPVTVGEENLPEFHVVASDEEPVPKDTRWEVHGKNVKGHKDIKNIKNTQLLHVVEHGKDILSFKSFDNDFLSVEKEGSNFKLVFAPWTFDDPKETAQSEGSSGCLSLCPGDDGRGEDKPIKDKMKFRMVPKKGSMCWWDSVYDNPQALQSFEYPELWLRLADGSVTVTSVPEETPPKEDNTYWMHIRRAQPKNEVDILTLDKTPKYKYKISSFGDLGTTEKNRTFRDVQDTEKVHLKSQLLLSSSVPPGSMHNRGHYMPAKVLDVKVKWEWCVVNTTVVPTCCSFGS